MRDPNEPLTITTSPPRTVPVTAAAIPSDVGAQAPRRAAGSASKRRCMLGPQAKTRSTWASSTGSLRAAECREASGGPLRDLAVLIWQHGATESGGVISLSTTELVEEATLPQSRRLPLPKTPGAIIKLIAAVAVFGFLLYYVGPSNLGTTVLKIVVADLKRFSDFMSEHLMKAPEVANIRSSVVLESIKETGAYPLQAKPPR